MWSYRGTRFRNVAASVAMAYLSPTSVVGEDACRSSSGPGCIESTNTNNYYYYYSTPLPTYLPTHHTTTTAVCTTKKEYIEAEASTVHCSVLCIPLYDIYICDDDRRLSAIILSIARRFSRVEVCRSVVEECKLMKKWSGIFFPLLFFSSLQKKNHGDGGEATPLW